MVYLADGTLADHLGLEGAWRHHQTIFVCDGAAEVTPTAKPNTFFLMQVVSILNVLDVQLRSLRVSQITEAFATGQKQGAYISLRSKIGEYGPGDHLSVDQARAIELSHVPGRLAKMDSALQERLINWGYAICDAAVRKQPGARYGIAAPQFPYAGGV